ncbi:nitrilase-related carbon-nitrogen hydrolase, partial [Neisseria gonorrhoeae]|uniref:nitrilase-related carbon-nitrogen hydrolase n=5 Tax=Neisseria gonorrhoeae TaxID=485 RepID=UPI003F658C96
MVAYRRNMPQGRQEKGEEMDKIRVAAVQMVSGVSPETNVAAMKRLVARAAEQGADWVLLPEYWVLMGANDTGKLALAEPLGGGRFQTALSETAKECGVVLFGGTVPLQSPEARGIDIVLADTAGRLPTQLHLMEEIKKVKRVLQKAIPGAPHEIIVVLDANIGQNAVNQVKAFDDALGLTGLIVTKLDGTAKGGILAALASDRPVPVRYI